MEQGDEQLQQHNRELEAEVLRLRQFEEQAKQQPVISTPAHPLDRAQLSQIRDRILGNLKLGEQAPKYLLIKESLNQFIKELKKSSSTPKPTINDQ